MQILKSQMTFYKKKNKQKNLKKNISLNMAIVLKILNLT